MTLGHKLKRSQLSGLLDDCHRILIWHHLKLLKSRGYPLIHFQVFLCTIHCTLIFDTSNFSRWNIMCILTVYKWCVLPLCKIPNAIRETNFTKIVHILHELFHCLYLFTFQVSHIFVSEIFNVCVKLIVSQNFTFSWPKIENYCKIIMRLAAFSHDNDRQ